MDLTVSLLKYRRTLGKASAILNTDAVGIGWERQYGVRFQTARSKSTEKVTYNDGLFLAISFLVVAVAVLISTLL